MIDVRNKRIKKISSWISFSKSNNKKRRTPRLNNSFFFFFLTLEYKLSNKQICVIIHPYTRAQEEEENECPNTYMGEELPFVFLIENKQCKIDIFDHHRGKKSLWRNQTDISYCLFPLSFRRLDGLLGE